MEISEINRWTVAANHFDSHHAMPCHANWFPSGQWPLTPNQPATLLDPPEVLKPSRAKSTPSEKSLLGARLAAGSEAEAGGGHQRPRDDDGCLSILAIYDRCYKQSDDFEGRVKTSHQDRHRYHLVELGYPNSPSATWPSWSWQLTSPGAWFKLRWDSRTISFWAVIKTWHNGYMFWWDHLVAVCHRRPMVQYPEIRLCRTTIVVEHTGLGPGRLWLISDCPIRRVYMAGVIRDTNHLGVKPMSIMVDNP